MKRINTSRLLCVIVCLICCSLLRSANAKIVYIYNGSIYVMNDNGRNIRRLTDNQFWEGAPRWSPDGTKIAFHRFLDKKDYQKWQLFIMNADGTNQQQLTDNNQGDQNGDPSWSPDGKHLAFDSDRSGDVEIYVMDLQSRKVTQLTGIEKKTGSYTPDWSPDGKQIVFGRFIRRGGGLSDKNIWIMSANGQNQQPLLPDPKEAHNVFRAGPRWFPDGHRILFHESRGPLDNPVNRFVIQRRNGRKIEIDINEKIGGDWVSWGECLMDNGRTILFSSMPASKRLDVPEKERFHEIYRYEIATRRLRRLTTHQYDARQPDWIEGPLSVSPADKKKVMWGTVKQQNSE